MFARVTSLVLLEESVERVGRSSTGYARPAPMAHLYLFFQPARLPLEPGELDGSTVLGLADSPELRVMVEQAFPGLQWQPSHRGNALVQGNWYEIHLPETAEDTLTVRCSLRVDHGEFLQGLCDRFGWLAFDERPMCFQPNREPFPA